GGGKAWPLAEYFSSKAAMAARRARSRASSDGGGSGRSKGCLLSELMERLPYALSFQALAGFVHAPGNGVFGNAEHGGGLGMGELLARHQDDRLAQGGIELREGTGEPARTVEI